MDMNDKGADDHDTGTPLKNEIPKNLVTMILSWFNIQAGYHTFVNL